MADEMPRQIHLRRGAGGASMQAARIVPHHVRVAVALEGVLGKADDAADVGPKWVQVTREGNFPGYLGGLKPFKFTRADLDTMVQNVRTHPAYELDANGLPVGHVIPWDFNHASEADPTSGDLPSLGAPAQAWTLDMEVRNGTDGNAQLWALTQFLEPAKSYVKAGQYKWASVAVQFSSVDPESGLNTGAVVTSIALTNTPFIEGMETLVAAKTQHPIRTRKPQGQVQASQGASDVQLDRYFYASPAKSVEDAIGSMKDLFVLPETAGAVELMGQIQIVASWLQLGAPVGTDPDFVIGALRTILGLPVLTMAQDVLANAVTALQALVQEQQMANGNPAAPAATSGDDGGTVPPVPGVAASARQKGSEDMNQALLTAVAELMGVRATDQAVQDGVRELVALRAGMKDVFKLSRDTNDVLLSGAKDAAATKDKLTSLFAALGVENPDAAYNKVAEVMSSAAKLKEVMPELEGLRVEKAKADEKEEAEDVAAAIAASKLHPSVEPALKLYRKQDPAGFAKNYPKVAGTTVQASAQTNPAQRVALTQPVAVSAPGAAAPVGQQLPQGETINLAHYDGPNPNARARAYLSTKVAGWDKLTNDQQWGQAVALRKQPNVIDQAAG